MIPAPDKSDTVMRVGRWMARAGLCSRRRAEEWIAAGRVSVDGRIIDHPAYQIDDPRRIAVDGQTLPLPAPTGLWRFHKPRTILVTRHDPRGRRTIFDLLPEHFRSLITVGRLDFNSEGLILLTNDGGLAGRLEHPRTGWTRRYKVRARGRIDRQSLISLAAGITVSGMRYGPIQATLDSQNGANCWLSISLREGKNREIRRVLGHLGLEVNRLIRLAYGPFQLGKLAPGDLRSIPAKTLNEQLGEEQWRAGQLEKERSGRDHAS